MEKIKYLVVGNGIASLAAIREIRKKDKEASIKVVSSEGVLTYYKTKLTEYISKDFKDEELLVAKEEWYKDNNIELHLNKIVEKIDTTNNKIVLDDSTEIEYEKLLIATGSRPFVPPITGKFKEGVFALRTLKDLRHVKNYLKDLNKITVIGGGLLGLEAAWSLKKLGKEVSIVEFAPYLLPKQIDKEISKKLQMKLEEEGFNIYLDSRTEEILGEVKVDSIRLNGDRVLDTEAILISVGIRPNLDLVRDTNIKYDKGILVDKYLKTNIDNVYAAGDVAEIDKMILGLWTVSNAEGKVAGANMTGEKEEYTKPSIFTNLQIGDVKLFSAGTINDSDRVYEYKTENTHQKVFVKEGKIIGAILFGDLGKINKIRTAVVSNTNIEEYLKGDDSFTEVELR